MLFLNKQMVFFFIRLPSKVSNRFLLLAHQPKQRQECLEGFLKSLFERNDLVYNIKPFRVIMSLLAHCNTSLGSRLVAEQLTTNPPTSIFIMSCISCLEGIKEKFA